MNVQRSGLHPEPEPPGDNLLRELAVRLLRPRIPGDSDASAEPQLFVGSLPDNLPVEVPLLDGCRVIGSVVRGTEPGISVVLDAAQPPEQVQEFYRERLTAAGWTIPEMPRHGSGGFMPAFMTDTAVYCFSERGPSLNVAAQRLPDGRTDVRLNLYTNPRHTPCGPRGRHHMAPMQRDLIPNLTPPPGARQMPQGGGGGGDSWSSSALLESDRPLAELSGHYAAQLAPRAGRATRAGNLARRPGAPGRCATRMARRGGACSSCSSAPTSRAATSCIFASIWRPMRTSRTSPARTAPTRPCSPATLAATRQGHRCAS